MLYKYIRRTLILFVFSFLYFGGVFNETIIPLVILDYIHLISNPIEKITCWRIINFFDTITPPCVEVQRVAYVKDKRSVVSLLVYWCCYHCCCLLFSYHLSRKKKKSFRRLFYFRFYKLLSLKLKLCESQPHWYYEHTLVRWQQR